MSLDLSTLKVGDTVTYKGTGAPVGCIIDAVGENGAYALSAGRFFGHITKQTAHLWSVVVPLTPCPITEPVMLHRTVGEVPFWIEAAVIQHDGTQAITVWPPGEAPDPMTARGGVWTWEGGPE